MKTPYQILDVATDAGDADIKQAYLQRVKDFPPDRDPERFQAIRSAYEAIKDHKSRISYALFNVPAVDFDEFLNRTLDVTQTINISSVQFDKLLQASTDDQALLDAIHHSDKK
ncbi:MAG: J domain-containing protein [Gammaproteobacteria bacterium]